MNNNWLVSCPLAPCSIAYRSRRSVHLLILTFFSLSGSLFLFQLISGCPKHGEWSVSIDARTVRIG